MAIISPVTEENICIEELKEFAGQSRPGVFMLRLDLIHPIISGNKWFKLRYNIAAAAGEGKQSILSFGGAYSNHLIACAAAAHAAGFSSVGMVKGLYAKETLTHVLQQCKLYGMELEFVSNEEYALKNDPDYRHKLQTKYPDSFIIPEGGANEAGRKGAAEIAHFIPADFTHILLSLGTGTTFAGLRNALPIQQHLLGFAPMKGGIYLRQEVEQQLQKNQNYNWAISDRFHFGGFGKMKPELAVFMQQFQEKYNFELDRVYTGKMMFGLQELLSEKALPEDSKILCIHTGGLTGN